MRSVAEFDVVQIKGEQFYNLIPSRFPTIRVFERINPERHDEIAELESQTNPRLKEKQILLSGSPDVDTDIPAVQNWNHAPFAYRNPEGSRFFGPDHPALELAADIQTAMLMAVTGRQRFLSCTSETPIDLEMRELCRPVKGKFADLRRLGAILDADQRMELGLKVIEAKLDGLLYHPHERPSAKCVSVLTKEAFERAEQGRHFKFLWDGSCISKLYDFSDGATISPKELAMETDILAA
tara:strand:+ start:9870 stop:10586 length:717 start_codon:yes stop_codon:yes gene_type:complete